MVNMNYDLKSKTLDELERIITKAGQKKYIAEYIFTFIHTKGAADVSQITPLSKLFRKQLDGKGFYISSLKIASKLTDDEGTTKYLFELSDGCAVEAVLLLDEDRRTLCISTQVGCAMNCTFCATAHIPFKRNLSAGEIADEVYMAEKDAGEITNVVYMGMGEPLNNYDEVIKSVRILNDPKGRNLGIRHITISTCGIVPGIKTLADEKIHPRLAISLNAPTNVLRSKLMAINRKYPLETLFNAVQTYIAKTRCEVTFEYVLIDGVNDTTLHAQMTAKLLKRLKCKVNLIEFNPTPFSDFEPSGKEAIERFKRILEQADIRTMIRLKKGRDIKAACGQLGADWNIQNIKASKGDKNV
jgi:23S rRNA (adenine2503-C2)-methyltransferase